MKNHFIIYLFFLGSFVSCTNNSGESNETLESASCYLGVLGRDSIYLQVKIEDRMVSGDLRYNFYEKDDNQGTLEGEFVGDTLFANYRFISEGIESEREVVFLRKGDILHEGYGEMEKNDGKMVFVSRKSLDFDHPLQLEETECP